MCAPGATAWFPGLGIVLACGGSAHGPLPRIAIAPTGAATVPAIAIAIAAISMRRVRARSAVVGCGSFIAFALLGRCSEAGTTEGRREWVNQCIPCPRP